MAPPQTCPKRTEQRLMECALVLMLDHVARPLTFGNLSSSLTSFLTRIGRTSEVLLCRVDCAPPGPPPSRRTTARCSQSALMLAFEKIKTNEQSLRLIVDTIPGFVCTLSAAGEVQLLNRQVSEYFGKTTEELKNWGTSDAVHPYDLSRVFDAWKHSVETGQPHDLELRQRRADGVYRWFQSRALPARDTEGGITGWYMLLTDIDDRKRAEGELEKAFEEIKRLKDRLHDENVVLREQIDQVFMFEEIVGSSPALKTVLSSIVKVAPTDSTVLITGETGTGKELIARAIH